MFRFVGRGEWVLLLFCLGVRFVYHYFLLPDPILGGDSASYLFAAEHCLSELVRGQLDLERTPVYPVLIALVRIVVGEEHTLHGIVYFQRLLSFLSILCFYRLATNLFDHETNIFHCRRNRPNQNPPDEARSTPESSGLRRLIAVLATLYYACSPCILSYNATILTESLAISCTVFVFWLLMSYERSPSYAKALCLGLSALFLVLLRPAFLLVLPILTLFWLLRILFANVPVNSEGTESNPQALVRRKDFVGLLATVLSLLLLLGYCQIFKMNYGLYHVSIIPYLNQFHIVIQSGLYRQGSNEEMNRQIQKSVEKAEQNYPDEKPGPKWLYPNGMSDKVFDEIAWTKRDEYMDPPTRMAEYAMGTIKQHRFEYFVYALGKFQGLAPARFCQIVTAHGENRQPNRINALLNAGFGLVMRFGVVYLLLVIELAIILAKLARGRVCLLQIVLWTWLLGVFVTAIVGAQCDWSRLVVPALPLVVLLVPCTLMPQRGARSPQG